MLLSVMKTLNVNRIHYHNYYIRIYLGQHKVKPEFKSRDHEPNS